MTAPGAVSAGLQRLNALSREAARSEFLRCCGSSAWAEQMVRTRPFSTLDHLLDAADKQWRALPKSAWPDAFAAHPRIGSARDVADAPAGTKAWAEGEQAAASRATEAALAALATANRDYEAKFGFIFLVCATGKSADEMLTQCRQRMAHEVEVEMEIAAEEQRKITRLRLHKLVGGDPGSGPAACGGRPAGGEHDH